MPMDIGFSVVESLKAIEQWINNINTNMVGSAKTGYKTTRISFGGSNTFVQELPAGGLLPTQQAEPSMRVMASMIDFTQGQVVASSQNSHFAIKDRSGIAGTNFFVVREPLPKSGGALTNTATDYRYYLTRDGEFHWVPATAPGGATPTMDRHDVAVGGGSPNGYVLVNNYNLLVLDQIGRPLFHPAGTFDTGTFSGASVTAPRVKPIVTNHNNPQNLVFSRFGSTIFDIVTSDYTTDTNADGISNLDVSQDQFDTTNSVGQKADRVQSSLESSNSSVTSLIPELTLAQKMFTALSKVLTVFNENLDITFGLIR